MADIPLYNRKGDVVAVAVVDDADVLKANERKWFLIRAQSGLRYAGSWTGGGVALLHRWILDHKVHSTEIDHIDGNGLNNRRANLRVVTHAQNLQNKRPSSGSSSPFRGVTWHKGKRRWAAQCRLNGKRFWLGTYQNEDDAACVAAEWRAKNMPYSREGMAR